MFDLPQPFHPTPRPSGPAPHSPKGSADPSRPFALTVSNPLPAAQMSGRAAPIVLARFTTLAEAMQGAIDHAEDIAPNAAPQMIAILARTDFYGLQARHAEAEARLVALMATNMTRLYDHLIHAGITHVMVSFQCDHDIYRITGLTAWADDVKRPCPDVTIPYVALDQPGSAPRKLALRHAIARIACDVLQDLRMASGTTRAADGGVCFDAAARANLLDYTPRCALAPSDQSRACTSAYARGPW